MDIFSLSSFIRELLTASGILEYLLKLTNSMTSLLISSFWVSNFLV